MGYIQYFLTHPVLPHLLAITVFLLAVFFIARLLIEKRQPSNTFAWLLIIILVPYVGVPLFLLLGGRKLRRLMARKTNLHPDLAHVEKAESPPYATPIIQTINAAGGPTPTGSNSLQLLTTGEETYAALIAQIEAARHSIHITTFILGRDETGRHIVALLAKRAREGVRVRLMLDAVGSFFVRRHFVRELIDSGGEVQRFMRVLALPFRHSANLRNHRKIAVFDGHTAFVGGHNLALEYMGSTPLKKRWRDFGAIITGPAALMLNEVFLADWSFACRKPIEKLREDPPQSPQIRNGNSVLQVVPSGPDVKGDPLYEGILALIQEARESVCIITPYFIPDEVLWRSLIVKARAGVDVTLVVPAHSNHPITDFARRNYTRELRAAGARVRFFPNGMMHSKAVIVDNRMGLFGSANFDLRSLFVNFEIGVFVYSEADVRAMHHWARNLIAECTETGPESAQQVPLGSRLMEDICRLFAPLL